ncbi:MAG TPA: phosphotransferase [Chthoniobacterales bacterium]|jgi:N-acetylmuramate 1-kinase|nr:phosphotransferase [Chthoniobacterales bacterium]
MSLERLIDQTRARFPHLHESKVEILPLEKGGSDRRYYRVRFSADHSLILVKYSSEKTENQRFVAIANFLNEIGVNAPMIYYHDQEQALIWMQDLGEEDLWHHRNEPWAVRRLFYESALNQLAVLHRSDPVFGAESNGPPGFDESLYLWEQNYCLENCLGLYFQVPQSEINQLREHVAFKNLAQRLASYHRVLVHRDFQSQNIIVWDEEAYLIDFQGMRPGLPQYDLASLLFDPYVTLTDQERAHLLRYYFERNDHGWTFPEFERVYLECGIQRLMQALGAYGVIGILREKKEFLRHIQPAIKRLIDVASLAENFNFFATFLNSLPDRPKPRIRLA